MTGGIRPERRRCADGPQRRGRREKFRWWKPERTMARRRRRGTRCSGGGGGISWQKQETKTARSAFDQAAPGGPSGPAVVPFGKWPHPGKPGGSRHRTLKTDSHPFLVGCGCCFPTREFLRGDFAFPEAECPRQPNQGSSPQRHRGTKVDPRSPIAVLCIFVVHRLGGLSSVVRPLCLCVFVVQGLGDWRLGGLDSEENQPRQFTTKTQRHKGRSPITDLGPSFLHHSSARWLGPLWFVLCVSVPLWFKDWEIGGLVDWTQKKTSQGLHHKTTKPEARPGRSWPWAGLGLAGLKQLRPWRRRVRRSAPIRPGP